uniref:Uncharacterized protein n=1 Tax=Anguilla anguilla TaxID=7936 RepID=A0A0E9Q7D2_ANGAN
MHLLFCVYINEYCNANKKQLLNVSVLLLFIHQWKSMVIKVICWN